MYRVWVCKICNKKYSEEGNERTKRNGAPGWGGVELPLVCGDLCPECAENVGGYIQKLIFEKKG